MSININKFFSSCFFLSRFFIYDFFSTTSYIKYVLNVSDKQKEREKKDKMESLQPICLGMSGLIDTCIFFLFIYFSKEIFAFKSKQNEGKNTHTHAHTSELQQRQAVSTGIHE